MQAPDIYSTGVAFLQAWSSNDMQAARQLLAPDVTFTSPRAQLVGADATAEAIGMFAAQVTSVDVMAAGVDADRLVVMYTMHVKDMGSIVAAERYTMSDGVISAIDLVFDTAALDPGSGD